MELKLIDKNGKPAKSGVEVSEVTFGREFNEALVHQVVVAYQANARTATRAQLGRGTVSHTTHKPWNQKGTGRARSGMSSSPIWRGGGRAFPNSPDENFSHKVNRKVYRAGMRSILSELVRQDRLSVIEEFVVETPKPKLWSKRSRVWVTVRVFWCWWMVLMKTCTSPHAICLTFWLLKLNTLILSVWFASQMW